MPERMQHVPRRRHEQHAAKLQSEYKKPASRRVLACLASAALEDPDETNAVQQVAEPDVANEMQVRWPCTSKRTTLIVFTIRDAHLSRTA